RGRGTGPSPQCLNRGRRILGTIDRRSGDKAVDTGLGGLLDVVGVDAAVDLDQDRQLARVDHLAYRADLAQHLGNEVLATETGLDRHDQKGVEVLEDVQV